MMKLDLAAHQKPHSIEEISVVSSAIITQQTAILITRSERDVRLVTATSVNVPIAEDIIIHYDLK